MKKKLEITSITNELEDASAFFPTSKKLESEKLTGVPEVKAEIVSTHPSAKQEPKAKPGKRQSKTSNDITIPRHHDTTTPRYHDTKVSRYQEPMTSLEYDEDIIEIIRKAVKRIGKEPATQRLTLEEKQDLKEIEFTYQKEGIRTNANEILRIATNYIINDYKNNRENSILHKVIKKLNS